MNAAYDIAEAISSLPYTPPQAQAPDEDLVQTRKSRFDAAPATSDRSSTAALTPEFWAEIEAERKERAANIARVWRSGLTAADWLFDGSPIRGKVMLARFNNLDWDKAWMDLGPSIMGNFGPYWHVPLKETIIDGEVYDDGDTVHRLYPKVLQTKWDVLILHACNEAARAAIEERPAVALGEKSNVTRPLSEQDTTPTAGKEGE